MGCYISTVVNVICSLKLIIPRIMSKILTHFSTLYFSTFTWSVPWLSTLAVIALSLGTIVLYYIPLRYLVLAWGKLIIANLWISDRLKISG